MYFLVTYCFGDPQALFWIQQAAFWIPQALFWCPQALFWGGRLVRRKLVSPVLVRRAGFAGLVSPVLVRRAGFAGLVSPVLVRRACFAGLVSPETGLRCSFSVLNLNFLFGFLKVVRFRWVPRRYYTLCLVTRAAL